MPAGIQLEMDLLTDHRLTAVTRVRPVARGGGPTGKWFNQAAFSSEAVRDATVELWKRVPAFSEGWSASHMADLFDKWSRLVAAEVSPTGRRPDRSSRGSLKAHGP